ncbi:MAG: DnaJ family molecular chaperone [Chitinophagales bacterium]
MNRNLKIVLLKTQYGKLLFKPYGYNKFLLPGILLLLEGIPGIWLGLVAGLVLDMQWISSKSKQKKPDLRISNLMLSAYVLQMSGLLKYITYPELKRRLLVFFDPEFIEVRFTFFNELIKQRIQVDSICKQLNSFATKEECIQLLKFLIVLSESSQESTNRAKAIYYIANKLEIEEKDFRINFKNTTSSSTSSSVNSSAPKEKDYYAILFVTEKVNYAELRKAYHKLAKQYHPDMHNGSPHDQKLMNEKFRELTAAYEKIKEMRGWD